MMARPKPTKLVADVASASENGPAPKKSWYATVPRPHTSVGLP